MNFWITRRTGPPLRVTEVTIGKDGSVGIQQTVEAGGQRLSRDVIVNADEWDRIQAVRNWFLATQIVEIESGDA